MREVLYLSYDGLTDPLGSSQVLPYIVGLARFGFRFTVISFEKPDRFARHESRIRQICDGAEIDWRPLSYTKRPPVLSTVYDLARMRRLAYALHARKNFAIVHARSVLPAMTARALKRTKGTAFIFDIRGFWAHERVDAKLWNLKHPVYQAAYRTVRREEDACYRDADRIVSLTHKAKAEIQGWKQIAHQPRPVEVIPCCVDLDLFDPDHISPEGAQAILRDLGTSPGDFVLSYLGSIGTWYMLPEMLDFFVRLRVRRPDAKFVFITQDGDTEIRQEAERRKIPTASIIVRSADRQEVPGLVAISDYSLFFIKPLYSKMASSPTKQGEVMAMGVPIVCNRGIGDTDAIVEKYDAGVLVPRFDDEAYDAAIETMLDPGRPKSTSIRTGAREWFSLERGVESYRRLYDSLLAARKP